MYGPIFLFLAIFGVPLNICTREYVNAVKRYCSLGKPNVKEIHFVDVKADVVEAIRCQFEKDLKDGQRLSRNDTNSGFISASQHYDEYPCAGSTSLPVTGATGGELVTLDFADSCQMGKVHCIETVPTCLEVYFISKNVKLQCSVGDLGKCKTDAVVVLIDMQGKMGNTGKSMIARMSESVRQSYQKEVDIKLKYKNTSQGFVFSTGGGQTEIRQIFHMVLEKTFVTQGNEKRRNVIKSAYTRIFTDLIEGLDADTLTMPVYGVGEYSRIKQSIFIL